MARSRIWRGTSLSPEIRLTRGPVLLERLAEAGIPGRVSSGYRSIAKQAKLYQKYLNGGTPAAPPGRSAHNFGMAIDIVLDDVDPFSFFGRRKYRKMHQLAREVGLVPLDGELAVTDPYHVELPHWRETAARLLAERSTRRGSPRRRR